MHEKLKELQILITELNYKLAQARVEYNEVLNQIDNELLKEFMEGKDDQ